MLVPHPCFGAYLSDLTCSLLRASLRGTLRCSTGGGVAPLVCALGAVEAGRCLAAALQAAVGRWAPSERCAHTVAIVGPEGVPSLGENQSVVRPLRWRSGCSKHLVCQQLSVGNDSGNGQVTSSPPR